MKHFTFLVIAVMVFALLISCDVDDDSSDDDNDDATDDDISDDDTTDDDTTDDDDDSVDDDLTDDDASDDDNGDDDDTFDPNSPTDEEGVFVATYGNDANPGTKLSPVRTIAQGLTLAAAAEKAVYVAQGDYGEDITPTVSLYGNYCSYTWAHDPASCSVTLESVSIIGTTERLVVDGFHIVLTGNSRESAALLVQSAIAELRNNEIRSDTGSNSYQTSMRILESDLIATANNITGGDLVDMFDRVDGETVALEMEDSTAELRNNHIRSGDIPINCPKGLTVAYTTALNATNCNLTLIDNELISGAALNAVLGYSTAFSLIGGDALLINNIFRAGLGIGSTALSVSVPYSGGATSAVLIDNTVIVPTLLYLGASLWLINGPTIHAINNVFQVGPAPPDMEGGVIWLTDYDTKEDTTFLHNNDIIASGQVPLLQIDYQSPLMSIADINQCNWTSCAQASNNINESPLFVATDDYHLTAASPCIDAGIDPSSWYDGPEIYLDFDGDVRPFGSGWDVGADEYITLL